MTRAPTVEELDRCYAKWSTDDLVRAVRFEADGYTDEARAVMRQMLDARGVTESELAAAIAAVQPEEWKALPRRRGGVWATLARGGGFIELVIYGGTAAAIVGFLLWTVGQSIWRAGSAGARSALLTFLALCIAALVNDVMRRRFSWVSKILVGLWGVAFLLLVVLKFLSTLG
jgi:hypothetical protein